MSKLRYEIYRTANSLAHLTIKKRMSADVYKALETGRYIYPWAASLLIRYKAENGGGH